MYLPSALIPPAHPGEMLHSWPLSLHFCSAEDKELPIRGCWASASQGFQPTSAAGCVKDSLGLSVGVRASLWVTGCLDVHFSSLLPHRARSDPTSFHTHRQRTRASFSHTITSAFNYLCSVCGHHLQMLELETSASAGEVASADRKTPLTSSSLCLSWGTWEMTASFQPVSPSRL